MLLWLALGCHPAAPPPPPSVLIVTMDTTRADAIGAYGNPKASTPNVDRVASEGVRFDRAYTVTPLTIPAHSSLFSGMFPPRHQVRDNGDFFLHDSVVTLAEWMKGRGYATMASVGAQVTSSHWGFGQGFDAYYDRMGIDRQQENRWRVERPGKEVVDDALGWLQPKVAAKEPFFAWVHMFDAHNPYTPPADLAAQIRDPYLAEVAEVDRQIGRLLDALGPVQENTWIFLMADHGEGRGSHGEQFHGVLLYDATTHIPMIVRPPGGKGGGRAVDFPTSLVDIYPTIAAIVGGEQPAGQDGISLLPWLTAAAPPPVGREVYAESLYAYHHYGWAPQRALIDADYKLIDSTTDELYGRGDTREQKSLVEREPEVLSSMVSRLDTLGERLEKGAIEAARASSDSNTTEMLAALGYMTATTSGPATPSADLPDPVKRLPVLAQVEEVRRLIQSKDFTAARQKAEALVAAEPGLQEPRGMLVTILSRLGETDAAIALAQENEARQPSSQGKVMLGQLWLQKGDAAQGLAQLNAALEQDPYLEAAWTALLRAYFFMNDMPRFQAKTIEARKMLPESPAIAGMAGVAAIFRGDTDGGLLLLEGALIAQPDQPLLNYAAGVGYRRKGEINKAESALLTEIDMFAPALLARKELVEVYAEQKRYADQLAQLEAILAIEPPSPLMLHARAQATFNLKRYEEAGVWVDQCRAIDPSYPGCTMLQANVLKKLGKEEEAYKVYLEALKQAGQEPPAPKKAP